MRDYLTVKTRRIPNIRDVYTSFKGYMTSNETGNLYDVIADVYRYSEYFVALASARERDSEITQVLGDINTLRVNVAYPFLLEVYNDYRHEVVSKGDFVHILKLVESYTVIASRRSSAQCRRMGLLTPATTGGATDERHADCHRLRDY
jgi:uncharacterized protein with ParB-like and HNH nuclease domain